MHICFSFCIFLFIEKLEIEKFLSDIWLSSFNSFYSDARENEMGKIEANKKK